MSILSIDTSLKNTSINIISGNDSTNKILLSDKPNHFEVLLPLLNDAIKELEINLEDISQIRVNTGPGNLMSLRIGITVANVLASNLHIPIYGISSFYAYNFLAKNDLKDVIVAIYIRNNKYSFARFKKNTNIISEYDLRISKDNFKDLNIRNSVLITDISADEYLLNLGFQKQNLTAENFNNLNMDEINFFIQDAVPIKPMNDHSYVVNN